MKIRARNRRPLWICSKEQLREKAKGQRMPKGKKDSDIDKKDSDIDTLAKRTLTLTVRGANWTESNYINIRIQINMKTCLYPCNS